MKIGTKSLLFGVHQFLIHPICVARAFRFLYQRWPHGLEWLAILVHDWGYWGCADIDGPIGKTHPVLGATIVEACFRRRNPRWTPELQTTFGSAWWRWTAGHSASFAAYYGIPVSALYYADKLAALMEPAWFYVFRAWLSGEGDEFRRNSPCMKWNIRRWFRWYRTELARKHLGSHRSYTRSLKPLTWGKDDV